MVPAKWVYMQSFFYQIGIASRDDRFVLWTLLSDGDVARHRCLVFLSPEWLHRWRWYRFYWYSVLWLIACHLPNAWYPVLRMWSVGVWKGCSPSFHCLSWFVLLNWEKTRIACNFPFKKRTESVGLSVLSVCFFMLSSLSVYRHFSGYKLCCLYTVCVYRLKEDSLKIGIFPAWIAAIM